MSTPSPSTTPSRVSPVSPVQWMRAFAYTPDSARVRRNGDQHPLMAFDSEDRWPRSEADALPTQFHPRAWSWEVVSGVLNPGCDPVSLRDPSDAYVSDPPFTVPAKRKWLGRDRETLSSPSTPDGLTQRRTRNTRSRTRCMSAMGGVEHEQDPSPSHTPASPSCRVVLDAVEIIRKKQRSQNRIADPGTVLAGYPTESAHKKASSHCPSPPISRADRDVAVHDGNPNPHILHTDTVECQDWHDPELTLPLKTSKYFAQVWATTPTCPVPEHFPALTPPSSPMITIPVYIESSDFEYPTLDVSFDEPVEGTVEESSILTWYNNPGLFDDLMIMLRRLKPILVQESVRDDPWKVLIAVRLLNVTTGKAAIPVFCKIISRWPTPQDLVHAPQDELVELLRPLGLYNKRVSWLKDMSEHFLEDQQARSCSRTSLAALLSEERIVPNAPHLHYPGVGPYALDSLHIFCAGDKDAWKRVMPRDKELVRYLRWRWAVEEGKVWYPGGTGVIGDVDVPYLITLVDDLAAHYDCAIGGEGYMHHFCMDLCDALSGSGQSITYT
ncbi:hypothetical protein J3R82DRAFT_2225 [Butyriboletus roseoflavus]|nr:hypothetical protein J3R82DRAFT_2225 [Butyriboletus roseoflavus]